MSAPDFAARGLVAQTARRLERKAVVDRLARGIARVGGALPGLAATVPTIAVASTTSAITGTLVSAVTNPAAFTLLRSAWAVSGATYPLTNYLAPFGVTDPVAGNNGGCAPLIRFHTSAPDFELSILDKAGVSGQYRLRCDGQYVAAGRQGPKNAAGALTYQRITWGDGSAAYRKPRLYELETGSLFRFGGVKVGPLDAVWPAPVADGLTVLVHGDSFVEGTGSSGTDLPPPLAGQIALLLGQANTVASGLGGTGFITTAATRANFNGRLQSDVVAFAPDVVIDLGGINDDNAMLGSSAPAQAAVTAWLQTLIGALPGVVVFMTGPMSQGSQGNIGPNALVRDGKKAAAALFPNNVVFIDNIAEAWVTGTGKAGAPKGDGNADWVTGGTDGSDGTHPTDLGHTYLARRVVGGIAGRLRQALLA